MSMVSSDYLCSWREGCWLGTDSLFRSLKNPNCSTPWKVSHWSTASVVRTPHAHTSSKMCCLDSCCPHFLRPMKTGLSTGPRTVILDAPLHFHIRITNIQFYITVAISRLVTARKTFISQDSNYLILATW
jgi:hypothetical protein